MDEIANRAPNLIGTLNAVVDRFLNFISDTVNIGSNIRESKEVLAQQKVVSDKIAEQVTILNSYMGRMEQSSLRLERLTYVIAALTGLSVFWYCYSFLKDLNFAPIPAVACILVGVLLCCLGIWIWMRRKTINLFKMIKQLWLEIKKSPK